MSVSSGAEALMVFGLFGPALLIPAVAAARSWWGAAVATQRLNAGRPARIRAWVRETTTFPGPQVREAEPPVDQSVAQPLAQRAEPPEDPQVDLVDRRARLVRVDDQVHILGRRFHYVTPAAALAGLEVSEAIAVLLPDEVTKHVWADGQWQRPLTLTLREAGPRWTARSLRARWLGAPDWPRPYATALGMLALGAWICLMTATGHRSVVTATRPANACAVSSREGGVLYEGWVTCWGGPPPWPEELGYWTLRWPFEGDSYDKVPLNVMVALPILLAAGFTLCLIFGALQGRRTVVTPVRVVGAEPLPDQYAADVAANGGPVPVDVDLWGFELWTPLERLGVVVAALAAPVAISWWLYGNVDPVWADWLSLPLLGFGDLLIGFTLIAGYGSLRRAVRHGRPRADVPGTDAQGGAPTPEA